MSAGRIAVLVAVLLALVGVTVWALTSDDNDPAQALPSPAPSASAEAPEVDPAPTPSATEDVFQTLPPEVVPDTVTESGVTPDYQHLLEEIYKFRSWLFEHPTYEEHLSLIYLESCKCHDAMKDGLTSFVADGEVVRLIGPTEFSEVTVLQSGQVSVVLDADVKTPSFQVLDADTLEVKSQAPAREWRTLRFGMIRSSSGRWVVDSIRGVEGSE